RDFHVTGVQTCALPILRRRHQSKFSDKDGNMSDFKSSVLQELQWRGFIQQMTHDGLDEALSAESLALYCGFDPTGPSLHVGHLRSEERRVGTECRSRWE